MADGTVGVGIEARAHVLEVRAKNVKCIREVRIDMKGEVHEIRGDAGQGKTSLLDVIEAVFTGMDSSMVRRGEDRAELELRLDNATVKRMVYADGSKDLLAVTRADGYGIEKAKAFLDALCGPTMFRPLEWVKLGGGPAKGATERRREQRDVLLAALPLALSAEEVGEAVRGLGVSHVEAFRASFGQEGVDGVNFAQHAFVLCAELHKRMADYRKGERASAQSDEAALTHARVPEWPAPERAVGVCASVVEEARRALMHAEVKQEQRGNLAAQVDGLRVKIRAAEEGLAPRGRLETELATRTAEQSAVLEDLGRAENEIMRLQSLVQDLRETECQLAEKKRKYEEGLGVHAAQDARRKDLVAMESELEAGGVVADLGPLRLAVDGSEKDLDSRRLQDAHDAAASKVAAHSALDAQLTDLVTLFWDTLPNGLLSAADLPVAGLSVDEHMVLIDGTPLHHLGGSQQIKIGVLIASCLNPGAGFLLVDGCESLGSADRLALLEAVEELDLQLIMTYLDADAVPGPGVTVMRDGEAVASA